MTKPANRWLAICAAGAMAIGLSACHKSQTATDLSNSAEATAPAAAENTGAMNAENSAATNDMSSNTATPPGQ
ncbi:MAG: hypothetical protein ACREEB_06810 [Caulobacteraceae bacterium]